MGYIAKSIGILICLIVFGNLILLVPDFVEGAWINFGAKGNIFIIFFGLIPIILLILEDLNILDVYSLPYGDIYDHCFKYVVYIFVFICSILCSSVASSLMSALSFILTIFIMMFPLYLFYDEIVRIRLKVKNRFINHYLFAFICGGVIVLSIGVSYLLALNNIYLPGDLLLILGTKSFLDGVITIPVLYMISIGGTLIYILYTMIRSIIIRLFVPEKEYKYATYRSERHEEKPNIRKKGSGVVKCCNNCRYYGFARNEYGEEVLCCRLYGAPTSAYSSCDGFSE